MSNRQGGYMLNDVLRELDKRNVFQFLGKKEAISFVKAVASIGFRQDCNEGEVFLGITRKFNYCYYCDQEEKEMALDCDFDLCKDCAKKLGE